MSADRHRPGHAKRSLAEMKAAPRAASDTFSISLSDGRADKGKGGAKTLDDYAAAIKAAVGGIKDNIFEIGCNLIAAKKLAGHGGWLPWLGKEFAWSDQTARNYMAAYEWSLDKSQTVLNLNLPASAIFELSAPCTPPDVSSAIIDRAKAGEKITRKTVVAAKKAVMTVPDISRHLTEALHTLDLDPIAEHMAAPYVKPADKYFAAQEAKLGPVAAPTRKITQELAAALKGKKATLTMWMKQHADDGIPALMAAFAASIEIIERVLK
jgi:hypothetical protein